MPNYALRLTPYPQTQVKDDFVRERIPEFIEMIGGTNYLLGRETAINIHYHIVFESPIELTSRLIKDRLYLIFDVPDDKRGNPTFSMEEVRDFARACQYATKDGDIECTEDWKDIMEDAFAKSKKKPQSYKSALEELFLLFNDGQVNERTLWINMVKLRAEWKLPINLRQIDELVLSAKIRKNPQLATEIWEERNLNID